MLLLCIFSLTIFIGSFLLFLIQPMFAKVLLPYLGGAPAIWTTCMVFYQLVLLGGYAYANFLTRINNVLAQIAIHSVILISVLLFLPIQMPAREMAPSEQLPIVWLLTTLLCAVGLPFFAVSTNASLMQKWFSYTNHASAKDPYYLYAASNIGSFVALWSFPLLVEPLLDFGHQSQVWVYGYYGLMGGIFCCSLYLLAMNGVRGKKGTPPVLHKNLIGITASQRANWTFLSFIPSSLMLGLTHYVSTDLTPIPLFWIIPLSLYLLTFIIAFSKGTNKFIPIMRVLCGPCIIAALLSSSLSVSSSLIVHVIALHIITFFMIGLIAHEQIAAERPDTLFLTEYYLWISVGGVLGGVVNAIFAPIIFNTYLEYPLILALSLLIIQPNSASIRIKKEIILFCVVGLATYAVYSFLIKSNQDKEINSNLIKVMCLSLGNIILLKRKVALCLFAIFMVIILQYHSDYTHSILYRDRSFYSVHQVTQTEEFIKYSHGTTIHGIQNRNKINACEPLSYYSRIPGAPVGEVFDATSSKNFHKIAAVGLGAGTVAAYAKSTQVWDFFEIDPLVKKIAKESGFFTYLTDCVTSNITINIIIGDGRLEIQKKPVSSYDLILLDAFSSDSIPMHLITQEAFAVYLQKMKSDGILIINLSNRYLDLIPIVSRIAAQHQYTALYKEHIIDKSRYESKEIPESISSSVWLMMTRDQTIIDNLKSLEWSSHKSVKDISIWTDHHASILSAIRNK